MKARSAWIGWVCLAWLSGIASPVRSEEAAPEPLDPDLHSALHSFHETFPDSLKQDAATYSSPSHFDQLYPDSLWARRLSTGMSNEDGSLAWKRSREMMAFLVLYRATEEPRYLDWAWKFSLGAMAARDDHQNQKDFQGQSYPTWGTTAYGSGRRTSYLVHSALILEPILETLVVLEGKMPGGKGKPPRKEAVPAGATPAARRLLLEQCIETLTFHEPEYNDGPGVDEGHYFSQREEESREKHPQPYNRQNVVAYDAYLVHLLTQDPVYLERAQRLALFFKHRLELRDDYYLWEYEPLRWEEDPATQTEERRIWGCDDVSHAFFAIEPVPKLVAGGLVFDAEDLARFARTLARSIHYGEGVFFSQIGCRPSFTPRVMENLPGWLCLSEGDPEVYPLLQGFMLRNIPRPGPLFLAYLIAFAPEGLDGE